MNGDNIRDRMVRALQSSTADYAEMRVEDQDYTAVSFRGREPDHMGTSTTRGGIVRACTRGGWGLAVFDSMEDMDERVREACRYAHLAGRETTQLAETPVAQEERPAAMENDFRGVALDDKIALAQRYNAILLEATLSFLGVGLPVTEPSLGLLVANGYQYMLSGRYWMSVFPGIALFLTVAGINLVADRCRDILNPRGLE